MFMFHRVVPSDCQLYCGDSMCVSYGPFVFHLFFSSLFKLCLMTEEGTNTGWK